MPRKFVAYFFCTGWDHFSLGFHVSFSQPNIEIHLPGGFLRLGCETYLIVSMDQLRRPPRIYGLRRKWTKTEIHLASAIWDAERACAERELQRAIDRYGEEPVAAAS